MIVTDCSQARVLARGGQLLTAKGLKDLGARSLSRGIPQDSFQRGKRNLSIRKTSFRGKLRVASALCGIVLTAGTLSACSGGSAASGATEELNILLHDSPGTTKALKNMTKEFEKKNPSVKVNLDFLSTNDYPAARTARLAAGAVDIVEGNTTVAGVPDPSYVKRVKVSDWVKGVEAGNWVDLSDQPFMKNFDPAVVDTVKFKGKSYQVVTSLNYYTGVMYNKDIFEKQGLDVPTTWSEFVAVMDKLKAAGITPVSIGGKDGWPVGLIPMSIMQGTYPTPEQKTQLDKALWGGETKLSDPKLAEVMEKTKTIFDHADPNFTGIDYATAEGQFIGGQAAMTFDGSWATQQFSQQNPGLKFGYFPMPGTERAEDNKNLGGKLDFSLAIPTASKNQDAAMKWLAFFSDKENYAKFANDSGIIPSQPNTPVSQQLRDVLGPALDEQFQPGWGDVFHSNPGAGPNVGAIGLNFANLAPMGKLATGKDAQEAAEKDWTAALPK